MRRLTALPKSRRDPEALKRTIHIKRAQRRNTQSEFRELAIAVAHQLRREIREDRKS